MQRFDLGHLEILETLLDEQSVSTAAARLNISPSALSRTLAKMREAVGDELLAPSGRELTLTKRGKELRFQIKRLNDQAREILGSQKELVPADIQRIFRIRSSDNLTGVIGTRLLHEVSRRAPQTTISFVAQGKEAIESFRQGAIDFDIGVNQDQSPELVREHLYTDNFICAFSKRIKISGKKISLNEFCSMPHILTTRKAKTSVIVDKLLADMGRSRRILATVSSFQEALLMASQSLAIVHAPSRLVDLLKRPLQLETSSLPLKTPEIQIHLTWHSKNKDDREHKWLRKLIQEVAKS